MLQLKITDNKASCTLENKYPVINLLIYFQQFLNELPSLEVDMDSIRRKIFTPPVYTYSNTQKLPTKLILFSDSYSI